ncbi:MAG: TonB-dependent receptor [Bacteroidetes bacterium]|nr:TonB-dependent receptor [Bacteroidota bacterium]
MRKQLRLLFLIGLFGVGCVMAQERTITGKVTSKEDNLPVPGANVVVQGTTRGTTTDAEGNFQLSIQASDQALLVSFVGYKTQTITIGGQTTFTIALETEAASLQEVVVVGYGVQKKSDLTGAISSVKESDITKIPSFSAVQSLQGKVAGLQVFNSSGAPGATPIVRVRGVGTFNNASPIFVVDGLILDDISFLNPGDIQSIEVLKDASATAIYGSRGANGVIIVTTKQGKPGQEKPSITLSSELSIQQVNKQIDMLNGREFATVYNKILPGTFNNIDLVSNTNWQSLIFQTAPMQTHQISISGSSTKSQYYFGVSYYKQEGIIPKSNYQRLTLKFNNTYNLSKNIKVGNNVTLTPFSQQNAPDVVSQAYRAQPTAFPYYPDSSTFAAVRNVGNPLASLAYSNSFNKGIRLVGNVFTDVSFLKDFIFHSSFGVDLSYTKSTDFTPAYKVYYADGTASQQQNLFSDLSKGSSDASTWLWENTITYNKSLGDHRLNILGGYTMQQTSNEYINIQGSNLIRNSPDLRYLNNPSYFYNQTTSPPINNLGNLDNGVNAGGYYSMLSYLFRANYTFKDRYLATISFRRDGSSKFAPSNRFSNFPSAAIGWNVINEQFMQNIKSLSNLKLRGSWGVIGNEKIDYLQQYSVVASNASTSPVFGPSNSINTGATFGVSGNPNLKWETTYQTDIGLEIGFFNNKLTGEFDYFRRQTNDILVGLRPAGYFGNGSGATITYNAGSILNRGLEFNVAWQDTFQGLRYRVAFLGNTLHNEVLTVGGNKGIDSTLVGGYINDGRPVTLSRKGMPIGEFYGYKTNGIFQNAAELASYPHDSNAGVGDLRFVDANKDGKIDANDRVAMGSPIPTLVYGFNFSLGYKNFDLQVDFQGQRGNVIFNAKEVVRPDPYNFEKHVINYWHGEGTSNTEPRPSFGGYNFSVSDRFIQSASYMRLRSITLAYSLPKTVTDRIHLKQVKLYVRGTNLFTISKFTGYSPDFGSSDVLSNNIDGGTYPLQKIYSTGLNITF